MSLFGSSEKISVVGQVHAKSGFEDAVRAALEAFTQPSRQEEGCLKYDLFEATHAPGSFFTYEEWESEAALNKHLAASKATFEQAKPFLREEISTTVLKQLA